MPFYTYICPDCDQSFTLQRSISKRDDETLCPQCESKKSIRLISVPLLFAQDAAGKVRQVTPFAASCGSCAATSCGTCGSG